MKPHLAAGLVAATVTAFVAAPLAGGGAPQAGSTIPSASAAVTRLQADILAATRRPGVTRAHWGIVVHAIERDERLADINGGLLFVPASVTKIVSVASAAEAVGWNFRFETRLLAAGTMAGETLHGDLIVAGSGDPSIGGRGGDDLSVFTSAVKAAGIKAITGRIIGDDDAVEEPRPQLAWAWDDLGYTTGALFGALNLGENRTTVRLAPGATDGAPTTLTVDARSTSRLLVNRTVTGARGSPLLLWPEQRPGEPLLTLGGSIPARNGPVSVGISVGNPTLWFASVLRTRLVEDGVAVTGGAEDIDDAAPPPARERATTIFTYRSPTVREIAVPLLKESINLYGEALLRLNADPGTLPTNDAALAGLQARMKAWGIPDDAYQIVDGSGLSRRNALSPAALLAILRRSYNASDADPFMAALPVAGVDGSLEGRLRDTAAMGRVRAKSGTMSNVRSLAGYAVTLDGEHLAFVIMANNFEGTGVQANQAIDDIVVRLASFGR